MSTSGDIGSVANQPHTVSWEKASFYATHLSQWEYLTVRACDTTLGHMIASFMQITWPEAVMFMFGLSRSKCICTNIFMLIYWCHHSVPTLKLSITSWILLPLPFLYLVAECVHFEGHCTQSLCFSFVFIWSITPGLNGKRQKIEPVLKPVLL